MIRSDKTVLHMGTPLQTIQPADDWLIQIAENYPALASIFDLLEIGNFDKIYNTIAAGKTQNITFYQNFESVYNAIK